MPGSGDQVAVVIPWRGGQPDREHHHRIVRDHLRALLPDAVHIDVDSLADPFSRAGSRNEGVRIAQDIAADVVVLCDADTLVEPEPLHAAIAAATDGRLHLPYTRYRALTQAGTTLHLDGVPADDCPAELESDWSTGGILVIEPASWWAAGGMDELFTAWGFEDSSFRICADALLGPTVKHDGTITHLWHPSAFDPDSEQYQTNMALAQRYVDAEHQPEAVRALLAERSHQPA